MKNSKAFVIISILILSTVALSAQRISITDTDHIKQKWQDIAYAETSEAQKLDIYLPNEGEGPFPVILYIHGGAFKQGDKARGILPMLEGVKRGYAVIAINYRLSGEAIWPAQIYDCKAAVRWIRANSEEYKLNPDKIAAWGGSAGGHLSAMVGTSGDVKALEDLSLGNPDQSSRVQAVVDWFGPTNFLKMDEYLSASGVANPQVHSVPESPESEFIGKNLEDAPELVKEVNPETYITSDDPPFLIQHGTEDHLVPFQGSVEFARKLGRVLGHEKVSLELFPANRHGGVSFRTDENLERVYSFLDKYLKE